MILPQISLHDALVVVDVQNDFCPGGALAVPDGDEVVPVINRIASRFPVVVATQDWHPAGHASFASAHAGRQPGEEVTLGGAAQVLWPDHCVQGSAGAEFHPDLDLRPVRAIVRKGFHPRLDSYSGFFENDRATPTGLQFFLQGLGVRRVWVTGLALDYCVSFTAVDAARLGFETLVITDAARGIDFPAGSAAHAHHAMEEAGVRLTTTSSLPG